ncbi:hypothetical protein S40285_04850 [Stachybotrys chlorohalonatus IBT 40285]|uniref:Peptidase A1 domain-containing protein n=1 Tax=Stachybotrys chlorohalonatus (strain IBT 40285) TaxID=1283841 RepID=A0A084QAB2_STAC4|nr:hypothetical protein S40285_04850 [Stachybotrys chlorohalonata IBT 40285]
MHLVALAPLLGGLATGLAARDPASRTRNTFSLDLGESRGPKPNFVREWHAAQAKWGQHVSDIDPAFMLAEDDEVSVDISPVRNDNIYVIDVDVGTPPQKLKLAIDTGSSDLWVQSTDTEYVYNRRGPWSPQYKPNVSETSQLVQDAQWSVDYVDGSSAKGIVYHDTVRMGDLYFENVTIQSAESVGYSFEREIGLTGLLGLAKTLPNNVQPPKPRFLDLLEPILDEAVFACDLKKNATGRIDFGHIDEDKYTGNIAWIDTVPDSPFWDIDLDLTSWDGTNNTWYAHKFNATVDTGTTLLFLPDVIANMYWFSVPGMRIHPTVPEAFTFPCDLSDQLPDLRFKITGPPEHVLTVPGTYLDFGPLESQDGYCWGGMQSADGFNTAILGSAMLKALYVAFDLDKGRVGFANKKL